MSKSEKKSEGSGAAIYGDAPTSAAEVRTVALTFDDGPSTSFTDDLLDYLKSEEIPAVFFVLGQLMATSNGRKLVQRAHADGHLIGNHSYSHANLTKLSKAKVRSELQRTHDRIVSVAGECKLFRPPYGAQNSTVRQVATELGYQTALWNVDTLDWKWRTIKWVNHAISQIEHRTHSTVLMHDIHQTTVSRVPTLITKIRNLGAVKFVQI